jgi:hypothetical protein
MLWHMKIAILVLLLPLILPLMAVAEEPDWSAYETLLANHVKAGEKHGVRLNLVDYPRLAQSTAFGQLVAEVRAFDVTRLEGQAERLAFYINAYNILTIQLILDHWPVASIKDIGNWFRGPWDIVMLENADGRLSLDDIEHGIIRPMGEPRIHFAVNCASVSCPDLRTEPYRGATLSTQLDAQVERFLAEAGKGLSTGDAKLRVSRLLDWYASDFEAEGGVIPFLHRYGQARQFAKVDAYLSYDWSINHRQD